MTGVPNPTRSLALTADNIEACQLLDGLPSVVNGYVLPDVSDHSQEPKRDGRLYDGDESDEEYFPTEPLEFRSPTSDDERCRDLQDRQLDQTRRQE